MSKSKDVAETLQRIGFGRELLGAHPMRTRAYTNGARTVKKLGARVEEAYASGELAKLEGIGKGLLEVIGAVLDGREVPALAKLEAEIPRGLFEMRRIRGLGPKKIVKLWKDLGLTSLSELEYACNENRLVELPGFGPATQDKVLAAIAALAENAGRFRLDQAHHAWAAVAASIDAHLAGDLRRGYEVITEVIAVTAMSADAVAGAITGAAEELTVDGTEVRAAVGSVPVRIIAARSGETLGAALLWHTGSEAHVEAVGRRAHERGFDLSKDGLTRDDATVPTPAEADVYAALGLALPPPERREASVPLLDADAVAPRLIERGDLQGALHNHTTASDGINTLDAMAAAAGQAGLAYLGISDHSQTAAYAQGLPTDALIAQVGTIAEANAAADRPCELLSGVESDILVDGSLDYPPEVLARLDVVTASVHARQRLDREAMTERMLRAARDPGTDIIGHPTGRLILGRPPSDYDVLRFLDACAESGCAVELNANPQRLDLNEVHLAEAKSRGLKVSIAADAHSTAALDHLRYGVIIARRAGLGPDDVLNAMDIDVLRDWLASRRAKAV